MSNSTSHEVGEDVINHRIFQWFSVHTKASEDFCKKIATIPYGSQLDLFVREMEASRYDPGDYWRMSKNSKEFQRVGREVVYWLALRDGLNVENTVEIFSALKKCLGIKRAILAMSGKWPAGMGFSSSDVKGTIQQALSYTKTQANSAFDDALHGGTDAKWFGRFGLWLAIISLLSAVIIGVLSSD